MGLVFPCVHPGASSSSIGAVEQASYFKYDNHSLLHHPHPFQIIIAMISGNLSRILNPRFYV